MKVLHLPSNLASQLSITVRALCDLGIEARGLLCGNIRSCDATGVEVYEVPSLRKRPLRGVIRAAVWLRKVKRAMRWADVIHWHSDWSPVPWDLELRYAAKLGKPRIVEFWGTDIRIAEIACVDNPYMAQVYREHPEFVRRGRRSARRTQERFSHYGFSCLIPGMELRPYVQRDVFPAPYYTVQRVLVKQIEPHYPDPGNRLPLIVHSATDKMKKGTQAVLAAVEKLRATHRLEFRLICGVPQPEAMALVGQCDVFLDQFVAGDYGVAAVQAMAMGKPAVGYLKPSLAALHVPECPLVNADQENLAEVLRGLLADGPRRHELGRQSRAYVEKYHDAHKVARDLVAIYEELLAKREAEESRAGR